MTFQIAVKLEDDAVAQLDRLVADGSFASRSEAVRSAVDALVRSRERRKIDDAFTEGFRRQPESDDEMDDARRRAIASIEEEPWEPWW